MPGGGDENTAPIEAAEESPLSRKRRKANERQKRFRKKRREEREQQDGGGGGSGGIAAVSGPAPDLQLQESPAHVMQLNGRTPATGLTTGPPPPRTRATRQPRRAVKNTPQQVDIWRGEREYQRIAKTIFDTYFCAGSRAQCGVQQGEELPLVVQRRVLEALYRKLGPSVCEGLCAGGTRSVEEAAGRDVLSFCTEALAVPKQGGTVPAALGVVRSIVATALAGPAVTAARLVSKVADAPSMGRAFVAAAAEGRESFDLAAAVAALRAPRKDRRSSAAAAAAAAPAGA